MCFPKDIQWLVLSDGCLSHSWNFVSVATGLTHQQQCCGTKETERGLVMETISLGMPFPLVCEDPLRLNARHTIKEILTHWKDPVGLFPVLLFAALAGYKGQDPDSGDCRHKYVQLVEGLVTRVRVKQGLKFCSRHWYSVCIGDCSSL